MSLDRLESESGCNGKSSAMGTPDLLAWETSRWNAIKEKEVEELLDGILQMNNKNHNLKVGYLDRSMKLNFYVFKVKPFSNFGSI